MALNSGAVNSNAVNQIVGAILGVGEMISVEQAVAKIGAGEVVSFEQEVQLRISSTIAESFIDFEQSVIVLGVGEVVPFEQKVIDSSIPSHLSRTGWDATLVIDGAEISRDEIHGSITIDRTEGDAALMDVTLLAPTGVQDFESYHGKTITLDVETASGIHRVYTGTVDIPEIDLLEEKVTLRCTDKRTELINSQLGTVVNNLGVYSSEIFRAPRDIAEEAEQRLTTIPYALDFDAYGQFNITAWAPKATADYTLADSDVYRDRPRVELTSRGRVINKVNINMQYRYERFYHGTRTYSWESPIKSQICNLLQYGYTLTSKSMVQSAITAAGWPLKDTVSFDAIHPSGWYRCGDLTIGWSTIQLRGVNEPVLDENGAQVNDDNGEPLFKARLTSATDYTGVYCMGANWQATQQWSQVVTENYTLSVQGPQSQTQFGTISNDLSYSVEQEANSTEWEKYDSFRTVQQDINYYIDQDLNRSSFNGAMDSALNQAKTTILGSHRDTRVMVETFIRPEFDLKHTIQISATELSAKGKVFDIKHDLNLGTGEATTTTTLVLSRAQGSASDSVLTLPAKPSDTVPFNVQPITLGNHFGEDPTTEAAKSWNGMIGNRWLTVSTNEIGGSNTFKTKFQESFVVDTPAIPESQRNARNLAGTSSYNVEIPNDTLTITFDGKA